MASKILNLAKTTPADWHVAVDYVRETQGDAVCDVSADPEADLFYVAKLPGNPLPWLDGLLRERLSAWRPGYGDVVNKNRVHTERYPRLYQTGLFSRDLLSSLLSFIGGKDAKALMQKHIRKVRMDNVLPDAWGKRFLPWVEQPRIRRERLRCNSKAYRAGAILAWKILGTRHCYQFGIMPMDDENRGVILHHPVTGAYAGMSPPADIYPSKESYKPSQWTGRE